MGVAESLGAMVKAFPQARLVAFADLSSRMILSSAGPMKVTQEHLDRLCVQARASFDDPLFSLSVEAFGEPAPDLGVHALQLQHRQARIVLALRIPGRDDGVPVFGDSGRVMMAGQLAENAGLQLPLLEHEHRRVAGDHISS